MANDIKQKIVLEGEKEYNRALSEAKRNLKTLRSELKAETAELGNNATAQQKNETRIKSLKKQIQEQEKIVKTYQEALKEVKAKYGDNEEAVAKWEIKLNDARTALANMNNELESVGQGFKNVQGSADMAAVASKSVADTFGRLGDIGGAISDSIESVFSGLLDTIKGTISQVWDLIAETAAKANNWTDLASYYGTTASEIERMNKAVEWSQGNFGDFVTLLNQLSWGGKGTKITEWFGVSDVNYENKLNYAMDVLRQMKALYGEDPNKLGDAMEDIFGARKSQQLMWFVTNLETIEDNLKQFDEHGYGMGDESLEQMNEVWLSLGEIEGKWDSLKQKFAAGFGTVTLDIMANVNGSLDALADYLNAGSDEERDAALKALEKNITEAFERVKTAIEEGVKKLDELAKDLQNSDNPTAQALGKIVQGLVDALKWLTEDNMKNVVRALEVLAAFWLTGRGFQMGAKILEIVKNIDTIRAFNAGQAVNNVAKAASGGQTVANSGIGASWLTAIGGTASNLATQLLANGGGMLGAALYDQFTHGTNAGRGLQSGGLSGLWHGLLQDMSEVAVTLDKNAQTLASNWDANSKDANVIAQLGRNNIIFWDKFYKEAGEYSEQINRWLVEAERYAEEQAALQEAALEMQQSQPDENWVMPEDWSFEQIQDWVNQHSSNGGNTGNTDGLTSTDARNMTAAVSSMPNAVARGISGIQVKMDGATVGRLVAPYVSQQIAEYII